MDSGGRAAGTGGILQGVKRRVSARLLVVVIAAAVLGAGCGDAIRGSDAQSPADSAADRASVDYDWAAGAWEPIPPPPEGASSEGPIAWTGEELILWGSPGAAFRPADRSWRALPSAPIADRRAPVAVWTGTEVVYWGGASPERPDQVFADGAAYNPRSDSWRVIAAGPLEARTGAVADVVGGEVIVWGGVSGCCPIDSVIHDPGAARYDPGTDSWTPLNPVPEPWSGDDGREVTMPGDNEMYIFRRQELGLYDAEADEWRELPRADVPVSQCYVTGGPAAVAERVGPTVFTWSGGCEAAHGHAFDIPTRTWRTTAGAPSGAEAWTVRSASGDGVVFLLTSDTSTALPGAPRAHAYSTSDDEWFDLPPIPDGAIGTGAQLLWTGSELVVWGGWRNSAEVLTGVFYTANSGPP